MIKIPVVFVVGKNKNGFLPNVRIFGEDVNDLPDIPSPIPWMTRMGGELFGRNQPGNKGKIARLHILSELIQYIPLGQISLTLIPFIFVFQSLKLAIIWFVSIGGRCPVMQCPLFGGK